VKRLKTNLVRIINCYFLHKNKKFSMKSNCYILYLMFLITNVRSFKSYLRKNRHFNYKEQNECLIFQSGVLFCNLNNWTSNSNHNIEIPIEKLNFHFSRSSGPGGQNVNKLNTKAEVRLNIEEAEWLPDEIKSRLRLYNQNLINKADELIISAQEHRTQKQNKVECVDKLRQMIQLASVEPKERNMYTVRFLINIMLFIFILFLFLFLLYFSFKTI